ncbi:T9SS type B sorting domain-containing protein [Deminuibacter soli]|uniref:Ig-like domain-containing protein n=1 Tax=Deminuibacter soli TaxID=2291815 RepID=A0A3E1NIG7_9BACT|nr:gliding motility-associated C-terminal domain-containing protein [Deminuibacter soli]RFM27723.1 hypothetical protein DXN05_13545 [Deminuibacter soli]
MNWRIIVVTLMLALPFARAKAQTDTAFWIGIPVATKGHATVAESDMELRVTTLSSSAVITVSVPGKNQVLYTSGIVAANSVISIPLTTYRDSLECQFGKIGNWGLKVTATAPVTAYYDEASVHDPEIFALKGGNGLGVKFYVPGQDIWSNASGYSPTPYNTATIVATQDNTTINFKPSTNCQGGYLAGQTYTIKLNKGQTFCFASNSTSAAKHLGGSYITSDKPIAVTMSDDSVGAKDSKGTTCYDMGGDQLVPTNMYGLEYISPVGTLDYQTIYSPVTKDLAVVTALIDNTTITFSQGGQPDFSVTINAGKSYEFLYKDSALYINASAPISLMHVTGNGCELGYAQVPPINCTGSNQVGVVRPNAQQFSLVVLVPKAGINGFVTKVNGTTKTLIPPTAFVPIPNTTWMYAKIFNLSTATVPSGGSIIATNTGTKFHMGIICGDGTTGCSYGYFSDFASFKPIVTATPNPVCAGQDVQLACDPVNHASGQTFIWTGPNSYLSTDQNPLVTIPATSGLLSYYCQVTQPGCSYPFQQVDVTVNPSPDIIITGSQVFCNGAATGNINFTSSVPKTTFSWVEKNPTPGIGMPTSSGTNVTKINSFTAVNNSNSAISDLVLVTATAGACTTSTNMVLTANPTPDITTQPVDATVCQYSDATFFVTSKVSDAQFQWYVNDGSGGGFKPIGGATNDTLIIPGVSIAQHGYKYQVIVTSPTYACSSRVSNPASLRVYPAPVVKTVSPAAPCYPGTVNLKAAAVTAGSDAALVFSYFTDAAGTVPLADPTKAAAPGTYYIVGTRQSSGCSSLPIPVVVTSKPQPVVKTTPQFYCKYDDVNLKDPSVVKGSDAGLTYAYYYDTLIQKPISDPTHVTAATYYIVGTNTSTGCTSKATPVVVTQYPVPVIVTHDSSVCAPNTVDLTKPSITVGSSPNLKFSYFLDNIQQYPIADPTKVSSGTYYIVGLDTTSNCSSVATPVKVIVKTLPNVVTNDTAVCAPATVNLTWAGITKGSDAGLAFSYFLDGTATNPVADPTSVTQGNYYIVGKNATSGCQSAPKLVRAFINAKPTVVTKDQTACFPSTVDLTDISVTDGSDAGLVYSYYTNAAATKPLNPATSVTTGTYYIIGTNNLTTCVSIAVPVKVTIIAQPKVVTHPLQVCSPNYVDLTSPNATVYSDAGLIFTYYTDAAATNFVGTPNTVNGGTYYIVGTNPTTHCASVPTAITATINSLPNVVTVDKNFCAPSKANLKDPAITAGSDAGLTFTYFNDNNLTSPVSDPTNVVAGTYWIVGQSGTTTCKSNPISVTVGINPQPVVNTKDQTVCAPATVDLTDTAAVTPGSEKGLKYYYYSNAGATTLVPDPTSVTAGTYYIVGQNKVSGCLSPVKQVKVTVNPSPHVETHNPTEVCAPLPIDLTAPSVTAGSDPGLVYTYYKNAAATQPLTQAEAQNITKTGTYYIIGTIAATGCSSQPVAVTATINPQPPVSPIAGNQTLCAGNADYLKDPTANGVWRSSDTSIAKIDSLTGLIIGVKAGIADITYVINGTNGCKGTSDIFTVTVKSSPNLVINQPAAVCSPDKVNLTDPAITTGSDAGLKLDYYLNSTVTSVIADPTAVDSGTYYIKATNTTLGCFTVKPVLAKVNPKPKVIVADPKAVCAPNTVDLNTAIVTASSDAGLTYAFYTDAGATNAVPAQQPNSGTFYIVGTDPVTGCSSDPKLVKVTVNPIPNMVLKNPVLACAPDKIDLTALSVKAGSDPGLTYTYFGNAAGTVALADPQHLDAGTYYIVGTSSFGCSTPPTAVTGVINQPPAVTVHNPDAACSPNKVDLTEAAVTAGSEAGLTFTYYTDAAATKPLTLSQAQSAPAGIYYIVGTKPSTGCSSVPQPVTATVNAKPKVQVKDPAAICSPGKVDLETAIVAAGTDNNLTFNYYRDAAATDEIITYTQVDAGTYYIIGTNASTHCRSDAMAVKVTINKQPKVIITNPAPVCAPATIDLTQASVTAGSDAGLTYYYYSDALATVKVADARAVTGGTYYIVGVPSSGCPSQPIPVVATVNPVPKVVIINPDAVCSPDKVDLTAPVVTSGSDAALIFSYFDDAKATVPETHPEAVNAGTYYIIGTNPSTGCKSDPKPVIATVNKKPQVQVQNPPAVCYPGTVDLATAIVAGGTDAGLNFSYFIDAGGTKPVTNPNAVGTGTYYIFGTNPATHCVSLPMQVNTLVNALPVVVVANPVTACAPNKVNLTQAGITTGSDAGLSFTYYIDAATTVHMTDSTKADAGTYYIVGKSSATGCSSVPVKMIAAINPQPKVKINDPAAVCAPQTINLTAGTITAGSDANLNYTYYSDASATAIVANPAAVGNGVYYIVGTDKATGCSSVPMKINVTVNAKPLVQVNNTLTVCAPDKANLYSAIVLAGTDPSLTFGYYIDALGTKPVTDYAHVDAGTYYIIGTNTITGCSSDAMKVQVTITRQPTVTIHNPDAVCAPDKVNLTGAKVTAGSDGGLTYTYFIDAAATTHTVDSTQVDAGTYYIVGTTLAGCKSVPIPVIAKINAVPTLVINNPAPVCSPDKVNLTAAAVTAGSDAGLSYSYYYFSDLTGAIPTPDAVNDGTYYIKATNPATGCSTSAAVTAVVNARPFVQVHAPAAVCAPAKVDLTSPAITAGSDAGLVYDYFTDASGTTRANTPNAADSGIYYIIGTNPVTGCKSDSKQVVVKVNKQPVVVITDPAPACAPDKVDLTQPSITAGSDAGLLFNYYVDAAATAHMTDSTKANAGTYYIVGIAPTGCTSPAMPVKVQINTQPKIVITQPGAVCAPGTIDLTSPAITAGSDANLVFSYYTNSAGTIKVTDPASVGTGTYYIVAHSTVTACANTITIPVTVTVNPKPIVVTGDAPPVCAPAKADLTLASKAGSDPGLTYKYYVDAGGINELQHPDQVDAGTYYVIGFNGFGCKSDAMPVKATINAQPNVVIVNPAPVCAPAKVDLTQPGITIQSDAGLTYNYYTDATATVHLADSTKVDAGLYYIVGKAADGCYSDPKLVVATINAKPVVITHAPAAICSPGTVDLTAPAITNGSDAGLTYSYFRNAAGTLVLTNPTAVAASGTYYILGYNNATGCYADMQSVTVTINAKPQVKATNPPVVCAPGKVNLNLVSTAGSDAGLSFSFYIDAGTTTLVPDISQVSAGTYYLVGKNTTTGCVSDAVPVIASVNPQPNVVITNPPAACAPATVNLTLSGVTNGSDAGLTYNYYTDAAATTHMTDSTKAPAGTYYIVGRAATGCTSEPKKVVVTVNSKPVVVATSPAPVCAPGTADLTAPSVTAGSDAGLTFAYYINVAKGIKVPVPQQAGNGTYYIVGTAATGCTSDSVKVQVVVNPQPQIQVANPPAVCAPSTVDLTKASTAGSDPNLTFKYYMDAAGSSEITTPTSVSAGTYYVIGINNTTGCLSVAKKITATVRPQPKVVVTNPPAVCAPGKVNLTQSSVTNGSDAGLTYNYYTDAATTTHVTDSTAVTAGTYYIVGIATTGCVSKVMPVVASINPQPNLVITNPAPVCAPGKVDITLPAITAGSEGGLIYTYFQDAAGTTVLSNPKTIGSSNTYYIKGANNATTCYSIKPVVVTVNPQPQVQVTANPAAACAPALVDLGTATLTLSNPSLAVKYYRDAAASVEVTTPNAVAAGKYYVVATDPVTGCSSAAAAITVTINKQPNVVTVNPAPLCSPATADLTVAAVTAGSDAFLQYKYYTDAAGTIALTDPAHAPAGTYYIVGSNTATGCSSDPKPVTVTVNNAPTMVVNQPPAVCAPATVDLTAPAITQGSDPAFNRFDVYVNVATGTLLADPVHAKAGTYYIVGVVTGGCNAPAQAVTVTINPQPVVTTVTIKPLCAPAKANLKNGVTADPKLQFSYYMDAACTIPVPNSAAVDDGVYYVIGTDKVTGCTSVPQPITVTVYDRPEFVVNQPAAVCSPGTVDLTSNAVLPDKSLIYSYFTDNLATVPMTTPTQAGAGDYYIVGKTLYGCKSEPQPVHVTVNPQPVVVFAPNPITLCAPDRADLTSDAYKTGSTPGLTYTYYQSNGTTVISATAAAQLDAGDYFVQGKDGSGCSSVPVPVKVIINKQPQVTFHNPPAVCEPGLVNLKDPSVIVTSDVITAVDYYTDNGVTPVLNPAAVPAGNYVIVVTGNNNCKSVAGTVQAIVNAKPKLQLNNPAPVCEPSLVNLTQPSVTQGNDPSLTYGYFTAANANPASAVPDPANVPANVYYLVGTSKDGCSSDPTPVTAVIYKKPVVTITQPAAVCAPATVNLKASAITTGSSADIVQYLYYASDKTTVLNTPEAVGAGTYYIVGVTGKGCMSDPAMVTVTVNSQAQFTVKTPAPICEPALFDLNTLVTADPSIDHFEFYYSNKIQQVPNASAVGAGTYYIEAITTNGCGSVMKPVDIVINKKPVLNLSNPQPVCAPGKADLTSIATDAAYTYQYYSDAAGTVTVPDPTQVGGAFYYITATSKATGCVSAISRVEAKVYPQPIVKITQPAAICAPAKGNLTDAAIVAGTTGIDHYLYYDATQANQVTDPTQVDAGTYYIVGVDKNGCSSAAKAVTIKINAQVQFTVNNPKPVCESQTVNLTDPAVRSSASPGVTYNYYYQDNTTVVADPTKVGAGIYYIEAVSVNGCPSLRKSVTVVVNKNPVLKLTDPAAVCEPALVNLTDPRIVAGNPSDLIYTYFLDNAGTPVPDATQVNTGTYYMVGTSSTTGCSSVPTPVKAVVHPKPVVKITNPAPVCAPSSINLTDAAITAGSSANIDHFIYYEADMKTVVLNPQQVTGTKYYIVAVSKDGCLSDFNEVDVTINSQAQFSVKNPAPVCEPKLVDLTTAVTADPAIKQFNYYYSDEHTVVPDPTQVASGTYYIEAITTNGCGADKKSVVVTINKKPVLHLNDPAAVCAPNNVDLTQGGVTAGNDPALTYTYFTDAAGTIAVTDPKNATAADYYVVGTSTQTGCSSDPVKITAVVNALPVVVITNPAAVCAPQSVNLTAAAVTAGSAPANISFTYYDPSGTLITAAQASSVTAAGTYYITATNNKTFCVSQKAPVVVTIHNKPDFSPATIPAVCAPAKANLTLAVAGITDPNLQFLYFDVNKQPISAAAAAAVDAGTYYVTAVDKTTTCMSEFKAITAVVNQPSKLTLQNPQAVCAPGKVNLTTPDVTAGNDPSLKYGYYTNAAATIAVADPIAVDAGTYYIAAVNAAGCTTIGQVTATVHPLVKLQVQNPDPVCAPGKVNLTDAKVTAGSDAGLQFVYYKADKTVISAAAATQVTSGTYYIQGINPVTGCKSDLLAVVATIGAQTAFVSNDPPAVCAPGKADLTDPSVTAGNDPSLVYTYYQQDGYTVITTANAKQVDAGKYWIQATTPGGCASELHQLTAVIVSKPVVVTTPPKAICAPGTVDLTQPAVTAGSTPDVDFTYYTDATLSTQVVNPAAVGAGTYYITATLRNGTHCVSDATAVVVTVRSQPVVVLPAATLTTCAPNTVDLTDPGVTNGNPNNYTFVYYQSNGTTVMTTTEAQHAGAGDYYIVAHDVNACGSVQVKITVVANQPPVFTVTSPLTTCAPVKADLNAAVPANAAVTYEFFAGSIATPVANATQVDPGTYFVRATDNTTRCVSDLQKIEVLMSDRPKVVTNPIRVCSPNNGDLTLPGVTTGSDAGLSFTYFNNANGTGPVATPTSVVDGSYYIVGTNINTGCTSVPTLVTVTSTTTPSLTITQPAAVCAPSKGNLDLAVKASTGYDASYNYTYYYSNKATQVPDPTQVAAGTYYVVVTNGQCSSDYIEIDIKVNAQPSDIKVKSDLGTCAPGTVDLATAIDPANNPAYTYTYYESNQTVLVANPNSVGAGTYYIVGKDPVTGCSSDISQHQVKVTIYEKPVVVPHNPQAVCAPATVDLTLPAVTAGSKLVATLKYYNASGTDITATANAVGAGTYTIVATSANGCVSDPATVTVTVNTRLNYTIKNPAAACDPDKVNLTTAVTGNDPLIHFDYYQANGTTPVADPTQVTAGQYYIVANDPSASCAAQGKTVTAVINKQPDINVSPVIAPCSPGTVDLTKLVDASNPDLTYQYFTATHAPVTDATAVGAGNYYIVGTFTSTTCSREVPVTITVKPKPVVVVTQPEAQCGGTVNIMAYDIIKNSDKSITNFHYYKDQAMLQPISDADAAQIAVSGTYWVAGVAGEPGGCVSDPKPIVVTIDAAPVVAITNPAPECEPNLVNLTAPAVTNGAVNNPNYIVRYFTASDLATQVANPAQVGSGTYYIQVTDKTTAKGCQTVQPVVAVVNKALIIDVDAVGTVCSPDKGDLTKLVKPIAGVTYHYYLADGITEITSTAAASVDAGYYYVSATSTSASCASVQHKVQMIAYNKPDLQLKASDAICAPALYDLTNTTITQGSSTDIVKYKYFNQATNTEVLPADAVKVGAGTYTIQAFTINGCSDSKNITVTINPQPKLEVKNPQPVCAPNKVDLTTAVQNPDAAITYTYYDQNKVKVADPTKVDAGQYYIQASYAATTGCTSDMLPVTVTTIAQPVVQNISGQSPIWVNNQFTFTSGPAGGTWSVISTDKTIVSVDPVTGVVTANKVGGPATVQYAVGNAQGCYAAKTMDVYVIAQQIPPITDPGGNTGNGKLCIGQTVDLTETYTGGKWSVDNGKIVSISKTTGTTITVTGLSAGTTDVVYTTTNPNGSVRYTIVVNPTPQFSTSDVIAICTGSKAFSTTPKFDIAGTTLGTWTRDNASGITVAPAGNSGSGLPQDVLTNSTKLPVDVAYHFKLVSPMGCSNANALATVRVYPKANLTVDQGSTYAVCEGGQLKLTGKSDISGVNFIWKDAAGNVVAKGATFVKDNVKASDAQTYTFMIDAQGTANCSVAQTIKVSVNAAPVATFNGLADFYCEGSPIKLTASSNTEVTYNWYTPNGKQVPGSTFEINEASMQDAGTYRLEAYDAAGGNKCPYVQNFPVVVNATPVTTITEKGPFCQNKTMDLVASSRLVTGTSFEWTDVVDPTIVRVKGAELKLDNLQGDSVRYYVHAKNTNGCFYWLRVSKAIDRTPKVDFPPIANVCQNAAPFELTASETAGLPGVGVFTGSGITSRGTFNPSLSAGTYSITYTYTVQGGCSDSKTNTFKVYPVPYVDAGEDVSMFEGMSAQLKAVVQGSYTSLLWSPYEDSASSHSLTPVVHPKQTTLYTLKVTNNFGCAVMDNVNVMVMKFELPNAISPNGDGINDTWVIKGLSNYPNALIEIFNRWGVPLWRGNGKTPWDGKYNGQYVPAGTYYYLIRLNDGVQKKPLSGWLEVVR